MGTESWLSRIQKNRELKRKAKLQKKFEFLIEELNMTQDRVITQVITQESEIISSKFEELANSLIHSIDLVKTDLDERSNNMVEQISAVKREHQIGLNETKLLFDTIFNKLEEIYVKNCSMQDKNTELLDSCSTNIGNRVAKCEERISSQISETSYCIQGQIECVQAKELEQNEDIQQILKSIVKKIEMVQNNTSQLSEECSSLVEDKSNSILLSIDEVKALMKIVAVNNLLNEI